MNPAQARSLASEVLQRIAPDADLATVREDEDLREALDLDSMDFMRFVVDLGERTGISIPDADTPRLFTLRGLQGYLDAHGR